MIHLFSASFYADVIQDEYIPPDVDVKDILGKKSSGGVGKFASNNPLLKPVDENAQLGVNAAAVLFRKYNLKKNHANEIFR